MKLRKGRRVPSSKSAPGNFHIRFPIPPHPSGAILRNQKRVARPCRYKDAINMSHAQKMTGSAGLPPSPEIAFAGGHDLSAPSHSHKDSVPKGNRLKPLFRFAILLGPSNGVFGSHNATRVADGHKPAVSP